MTRQEALERLEGTWSFELNGGKVMIRDLSLIATVAAIRRERPVWEPAGVSSTRLTAATSGD